MSNAGHGSSQCVDTCLSVRHSLKALNLSNVFDG